MMKTTRILRKSDYPIVWAGCAVVGVMLATAPGALAAAEVTFTKDIAPILQRSCQNCHRPSGGIAPMALTTYEEVRPWARAIKQRTAQNEMPPWFIEKNIGIQKFKDDPSLSEEEIATIGAWVDSGAPQGNPADMPPLLTFPPVGAWTYGTPDLIVNSPLITLKAVGGDWHGDVGSSPTGLTEDRYIKSVEVREFRPEQEKIVTTKSAGQTHFLVVHHASVQSSETGDQGDADNASAAASGGNDLRYLYEVGQNPMIYPDDFGVKLLAGSRLYFFPTCTSTQSARSSRSTFKSASRSIPKISSPSTTEG